MFVVNKLKNETIIPSRQSVEMLVEVHPPRSIIPRLREFTVNPTLTVGAV